ncbi:MAG: dihydroorotase [Candidatus Staskawiczbacteria bacterium]|jgi:dihydroorotase
MKARRIDPHVHCRDQGWAYKSTIAETLKLAELQGICAIFDMPNNNPPTLRIEDVLQRLALVPEDSPVQYFTYIGLAADNPDQWAEAVRCWNNIPQVIGIKMFAGHSTANMGIIEPEQQRAVYRFLTEVDYRGVLAVHCEKESLLRPALWDPKNPVSHSLARPPEAEAESVRDQILFAEGAGFCGKLHICHVSTEKALRVIARAKDKRSLPMRVTCEVTPHHLLYSTDMLEHLGQLGQLSHWFKVNPPIRIEQDRLALLGAIISDNVVDWIATDNAPHTMQEKLGPPYTSGFPSLYLYQGLLAHLRELGVSEEKIDDLTFYSIIRAFNPKLNHLIA